jgi:predicted membrane protein
VEYVDKILLAVVWGLTGSLFVFKFYYKGDYDSIFRVASKIVIIQMTLLVTWFLFKVGYAICLTWESCT